MGSIECIQGQAEGLREQLVLVPISEGIPQDILESFGVQESQEDLWDLQPTLELEQSTQLYSGEMREFLPSHLGDEGVPPISSGRLGLVLRGEELIRPPGAELGVWVCDPLEDWSL